VHSIEEVRTKAIRLVANKLYPLSYLSQNIEEFATKKMLSVVDGLHTGDGMDIDESRAPVKEDDSQHNLSNGAPKIRQASGITVVNSSGNDRLGSVQSASNVSIAEAQRCMSLYFALCTKKHSLLQQIFSAYKNAPKAVKQAVQRHIPILIRTIRSSPQLLCIISNPPEGSENLLMQVLQILTDGTSPPPDLIATVKRLYETKLKDAGVLIPILSSLTKDEVLPIFPKLVDLPLEKFQAALARILQGSAHTGPSLTPAEVLISIHGIDPERDGIQLKKVIDACSTCFEQRAVFTQQVLAKVLNQLVEQTPLPLLFMRTVIQAIGAFPALVDFVMEILSRLVNKQIWRLPKLWVGFLKCAYQTKPHSFHVLLQLPAAQLENAFNKTPALRVPLVAHASQPNIRSSLPRSTLVVLGLVQDAQPANSAPQIPPLTDAGSSGQIATETQASESAVLS
jgi:symplekin